jgi:hypothetical protein
MKAIGSNKHEAVVLEKKKIIVIRNSTDKMSCLLHNIIKESFGEDLKVLTQDQAIKYNLTYMAANTEIIKIYNQNIYDDYTVSMTGVEKRRKKRIENRKLKLVC